MPSFVLLDSGPQRTPAHSAKPQLCFWRCFVCQPYALTTKTRWLSAQRGSWLFPSCLKLSPSSLEMSSAKTSLRLAERSPSLTSRPNSVAASWRLIACWAPCIFRSCWRGLYNSKTQFSHACVMSDWQRMAPSVLGGCYNYYCSRSKRSLFGRCRASKTDFELGSTRSLCLVFVASGNSPACYETDFELDSARSLC